MPSIYKMLRIACDLKQTELSELTGVPQPRISRIDNELIAPTPEERRLLARIMRGKLGEKINEQKTNDGRNDHDLKQ